MVYKVINLRNNEVVYYNDLERAERFIRISVTFNNKDRKLNEKMWNKNDFKIIKEVLNNE